AAWSRTTCRATTRTPTTRAVPTLRRKRATTSPTSRTRRRSRSRPAIRRKDEPLARPDPQAAPVQVVREPADLDVVRDARGRRPRHRRLEAPTDRTGRHVVDARVGDRRERAARRRVDLD